MCVDDVVTGSRLLIRYTQLVVWVAYEECHVIDVRGSRGDVGASVVVGDFDVGLRFRVHIARSRWEGWSG